MTDFLPLEDRVLRHGGVPVAQDRRTLHGIERRQVLLHVIEQALLGLIGRVVFADFLVTAVVIDAVGQCQIHQAVAMAQAVIGVGIHECHGFVQGIMHKEVVVGGKHHVGRLQLLDTVSQLGANTPVAELRQVLIIHAGEFLRDALQRHRR